MLYRRIASLRTAGQFQDYLYDIGADISFDSEIQTGPESPLAQPYTLRNGFTIGNRFCVLPMEGWDGTLDGCPTKLTQRRWRRFGESGAKLIWGCEAVAVRPDARANPNQLMISPGTLEHLSAMRESLVASHASVFGATDDLLIGLQLTHSGRFARPYKGRGPQSVIVYHHPLLDARSGVGPDTPLVTDDELGELIQDFVRATVLAQQAGFHFVDVKHCHGYLGHELLSAIDRPGRYGGSFENRTRFLREVVQGIRAEAPGLGIGVRFSAFDFVPFRPGADGVGEPVDQSTYVCGGYRWAFGGDGTGLGTDMVEPYAFLDLLAELDIELVCVTGGSPYYNPHIQRPALYPPSDGYQPPEDPLLGVARHIGVTARLKAYRPDLAFVGSGYSYLQEWLPNVAQYVARTGRADFVGLGRMVLPYPDMPADVLAGRPLQRKRICRTFSDCTTAPRYGLVSGCYPLDSFYSARPEKKDLREAKRRLAARLEG